MGTLLAGSPAFAQTDEIQVYDGSLAEVGVFNLTWHNNYTPSGVNQPAFPGAVVSNKSWNGVPEWAYGVTTWFEAGLYMPLYTHDQSTGWGLDGFKIRLLFAVPHADERRFFYGSNFEFSWNAKQWDPSKHSAEIRPIVGWHLNPVDIIVNPILDTSWDGFKNLDFAPATRVAYNFSSSFALAAEEYADFGPISGFAPVSQQYHMVYAVTDWKTHGFEIEGGVGFGLTSGTDNLTIKVIVSRDLNAPPKH